MRPLFIVQAEAKRLKRENDYINGIGKERSAKLIQALARRRRSVASLQAARRAATKLQMVS